MRIILACTNKNDWILAPFAGSTTGIAANLVNRRYLGTKKEREFAEMSSRRREEINNFKIYADYRSKIKDIAKSEISEPSCFACEDDIINVLPFKIGKRHSRIVASRLFSK